MTVENLAETTGCTLEEAQHALPRLRDPATATIANVRTALKCTCEPSAAGFLLWRRGCEVHL